MTAATQEDRAALNAHLAEMANARLQRIAAIPDSINGAGVSNREREVLALLMEGCTNNEIATALVIAVETVKTHVGHMLKRTKARNRVQLAAWGGTNIVQASDWLDEHQAPQLVDAGPVVLRVLERDVLGLRLLAALGLEPRAEVVDA